MSPDIQFIITWMRFALTKNNCIDTLTTKVRKKPIYGFFLFPEAQGSYRIKVSNAIIFLYYLEGKMTNTKDLQDGKMTRNEGINVGLIVRTAVMAAITFVAAFLLHVPYINGNVLHLGDGMVFIGAIVLGPVMGAVSAGIGMGLFDILSGYAVWAPFTLIIKAAMAFTAGYIGSSLRNEEIKGIDWLKAGIGMVLGALIMCAGYYGAEGLLYGNWQSPMLAIPGNLAQSGFGVLIGMAVLVALWKTPLKNTLLNRK